MRCAWPWQGSSEKNAFFRVRDSLRVPVSLSNEIEARAGSVLNLQIMKDSLVTKIPVKTVQFHIISHEPLNEIPIDQ